MPKEFLEPVEVEFEGYMFSGTKMLGFLSDTTVRRLYAASSGK